MSSSGIFLFVGLVALLGCKSGVYQSQFKRLETYKTPYIELNVPQGLYPVKGNEAVFRKLFINVPQGNLAVEMFKNGGVFLDPAVMNNRWRMVTVIAEPALNGCAEWMKGAERINSFPRFIGDLKTEIISGRKWLTHYRSADHTLDFFQCEHGVSWNLAFSDTNASNRLALFAEAKRSVESAK